MLAGVGLPLVNRLAQVQTAIEQAIERAAREGEAA